MSKKQVFRVVVPKEFPQVESLKKIVSLGEKAEVSGPVMQVIKQNWRAIIYDICSGLAAHDIAVKYQIAERSFWNFLKAINITMRDIQNACKEEEEFKKITRIEKLQKKMERLKIVPTDINQFMQLDVIQELVKQLRLKGDTERSIDRNIKAIFELCMYRGKHPDDLTIEDILDFLDYKRLEWAEKGKDLRKQEILSQFSTEYISPLRVWCKFKGLPIPPALTTVEYYSPYRKVRITVEQRYQLLKYIYDKYRNIYETIRAVLIFLYETGSRAQALRNVQFIETEEFGQKVIYAITEEKGKRTQIRWEKPINPKWWTYIKGFLPIRSDNMLRRIKEILREAYEVVLPDGIVKKYALSHPFHVWRHTAANDLLEASNYNLMLVAQKLGWKNVQMIVNVYGTMDKAMLLRLSGYNIEYQAAKFEFLYDEYYQRAKEEGLI
jgi:Phage integrase family.